MQTSKVRVSVGDSEIEVSPGFESLARAILKLGINLVDAFSDDVSPDHFTLVFPESEDMLSFVEAFVLFASAEAQEGTLDAEGSLTGSYVVDCKRLGDEVEAYPLFFLDMPRQKHDAILAAIEEAVESVIRDDLDLDDRIARPDGSMVRRSEVCQSEWSGGFSSVTPDLDDVRPGCLVRVLFSCPHPSDVIEKVWIMLEDVGDEFLTGRVVDRPVVLTNVSVNETVRFRRSNVSEVDLDSARARSFMN